MPKHVIASIIVNIYFTVWKFMKWLSFTVDKFIVLEWIPGNTEKAIYTIDSGNNFRDESNQVGSGYPPWIANT